MTIINVTVGRNGIMLSAKGHAGDSRVCSAVSVLVQTLAQCLSDFKACGAVGELSIDIDSKNPTGKAKIIANDVRYDVRAGMLCILRGFELLQANFPENVQYERR